MNKELKIPTLIGTWLAALLPCLALADAPSNVAVGEVDAILKFCAKNDPRLENDVDRYLTVLTGNASPGVRGTAQYKQGYDLVNDALVKVSVQTALAACSALANLDLSNRGNAHRAHTGPKYSR
jgi:hypothetical protein